MPGKPLILYRYINRQLFATTMVVTVVLMLVLVGGRFIRYLAEAAVGKIAASAIFSIMFFRLPEFLQLILPLSFYIAVLLVLGRMHLDNEMVVIRAGGMGTGGLLRGLLLPIVMMMVVVAGFSLYATPRGGAQAARILQAQKERSALALLTPGRFRVSDAGGGQRVTYAESINSETGTLHNIFISQAWPGEGDEPARTLVVRAKTGEIVHRNQVRYLMLRNGIQYLGRPGRADYRVAEFQQALIRLGSSDTGPATVASNTRLTLELLGKQSPAAQAALQWRVSLILIVPLMILLAVPLARANPRQGAFMRLIPALLLYLLYAGALVVMRSQIENARLPLPWYLHMGWVHLLVALGVGGVYAWPKLRTWRGGR